MDNTYASFPKEKFEFVGTGTRLHDEKLQTKSRSYLQDAFRRFKKNKSSVIAAIIIALLVLFAIVAPIISPYSVYHQDVKYAKMPPYIESFADKGILNGGSKRLSQNQLQMDSLEYIAMETGHNPIIKILGEKTVEEKDRGNVITKKYYSVEVNEYFAIGIYTKTLSYEEFDAIQAWQLENDIQVLYPWVLQEDVYSEMTEEELQKKPQSHVLKDNVWYKCSDFKGTALLDENGNPIPAYSTKQSDAGTYADGTPIVYNSKRIEGDDGSYVYSHGVSGSVKVRLDYYNYYKFRNNGLAPTYIFGTTEGGGDLFCAIGMGARFSLIFAVIVAAINLTIGAFYGAVQGYYGGLIDLTLDRISDILSGVPFIVVATLFKLHLAQKVGPVVSFLFAFVLTGWIGMAALTRKQFYRFKNQEYVMAARTLGASDGRLMFKHIFPNAIGTMITSCALVIPGVISSETSLSYLNIINLTEFTGTSLGKLMAEGQAAMTAAPHAMLYPALYMSLLLISFNLFGNGLRDAFNPSTRGEEG